MNNNIDNENYPNEDDIIQAINKLKNCNFLDEIPSLKRVITTFEEYLTYVKYKGEIEVLELEKRERKKNSKRIVV